MLATLLPGLRHVRTPLVAGAMWMLVIWLCLGRDGLLPSKPRSTAETRLLEVADLVGPGVTLAAASFVALLLGGLMPVPRILLPSVNSALGRISQARYAPDTTLYPFIADLTQSVYGRVRWIDLARGADVPTFVKRWAGDVVDHLGLRSDRSELEALHNPAYPQSEPSFDPVPYDDLRRVIADGINSEMEQISVQLQLERETIYNEVDRLRAEADLRLAIFLPGVTLFVVCAALSSWWLLLGIAAPILLLFQAAISENGARTRVATALAHGTVTSPVASFFRSFSALEQWPPLGPGNQVVTEADRAATDAAWDELLVAVSALQTFSPGLGEEDARPLWTALRTRATLLIDRLESDTFASWLGAELQHGSMAMAEAAGRGSAAKKAGTLRVDEVERIDQDSHLWVAALTRNLRRFRNAGPDDDALLQLTDVARARSTAIAERNGWDPPSTEIPGLVALSDQT